MIIAHQTDGKGAEDPRTAVVKTCCTKKPQVCLRTRQRGLRTFVLTSGLTGFSSRTCHYEFFRGVESARRGKSLERRKKNARPPPVENPPRRPVRIHRKQIFGSH